MLVYNYIFQAFSLFLNHLRVNIYFTPKYFNVYFLNQRQSLCNCNNNDKDQKIYINSVLLSTDLNQISPSVVIMFFIAREDMFLVLVLVQGHHALCLVNLSLVSLNVNSLCFVFHDMKNFKAIRTSFFDSMPLEWI